MVDERVQEEDKVDVDPCLGTHFGFRGLDFFRDFEFPEPTATFREHGRVGRRENELFGFFSALNTSRR